MPMISLILLVLVLGVGVIGIILAIKMQNDQARSRRLSVITGRGGDRNDIGDKDIKDRRLASLSRKLKQSQEGHKKGVAHKETLRDLLIYAGLFVPTYYFWIGSIIGGALLYLIATLMGLMPLARIFLGIMGFFGLPRFILRFMAGKRQKKFLEDFADGLESIVRLLKAGMPIGEAIAMVAREFGGPLGEEMGKVYESQRIGVSLSEAIQDCARRMPLPEVRMFATGIIIQQQTGSSLSDVLMSLAALIRARFRLKRKVHALSAEAKASAAIIGALPVLVATGLYFVNPDYISLLFTTSSGRFYLTCAVGWMMIGIIVMKQMINFKV